ncbi:MAG: hypothetical protein EXS55_03720 [Candidatus Magasanikbacteria bacterium]|nr:hypothetical protein [Candidatus Magasanikbacteria bacterium]
MSILKTKHAIAAVVLVAIAGGGIAVYGRFSAEAGRAEQAATLESQTTSTVTATTVPVETATDGDVEKLGASNISWPGEILSTADVQVFPAREGQIAEWRVRLGQPVYQGQVLGRLSAGPVSTEFVSALAERQQAIVRARANVEATTQYIMTSKQQLVELKLALDTSRDAAVGAAERNLQALMGVATTTTASGTTPGLLTLKRDKIRSHARQILQHYINELSVHYLTATSQHPDQLYGTYRLKNYIGVISSDAKNNFDNAVLALGKDLQDPSAIPEASTFAYLKATQKLLLASLGSSDADGLPETELIELRNAVGTDQTAFLDTLNEYNEAKITLVGAVGNKNSLVASAGADYAEKKNELDKKIAELDRELQLAQAEVGAAEAAYGTVASGVAGQIITAPQSGVISALYKNIGDHAAPDTAIAGISSASTKGRFVRFHIPSDLQTPEVGEEIAIERPGFPLNGVKAKVVGIGLSLDANGSYSADADFLTPINWPVHASVRVIASHSNQSILVPFTAVWWNDKGIANVWLVMENNVIRPRAVKVGRAVGDKIEIEDGLEVSERFVARATLDLKTGQSIVGTVTAPEKTAPTGDGHGHSHDE